MNIEQITKEIYQLTAWIKECHDLLEYVTYPDGRYRQIESNEKFQRPAQKLLYRMKDALSIKKN